VENKVDCILPIDSNYFASVSGFEKAIQIWSLKDFSCVQTLEGHTSDIECLKLVNSEFIASGGHDDTIKIWSLKDFECKETIKTHSTIKSFEIIDP
jgi:WD40 repeat protein